MASLPIIDVVAIADIETGLGAELPNDILEKPRIVGGGSRFDRLEIDRLGELVENDRTASLAIAGLPISMGMAIGREDAGPMEEVVDQAVDDDERPTECQPAGLRPTGGNEQARQGHRGKLRADPIDLAKLLEEPVTGEADRIAEWLSGHGDLRRSSMKPTRSP